MKKHNKGFTLIELMIVVAIIAIIAAIAIPNLLRSRVQSNESTAIGNLRTILAAQVAYSASQGGEYGTYAQLTSATPPFLESPYDETDEADRITNGYRYADIVLETDNTEFTALATPVNENISGSRTFGVDETGVIRHAVGMTIDMDTANPIDQAP